MLEIAIYSIILFVLFSFNLRTNYFHHKWFVLGVIVNTILFILLSKQCDIFVGLLAFYCLSSSLYVGGMQINKHFAHPEQGFNCNLAMTTLKTYIATVGLALIYLAISLEMIPSIFMALKILLGINIVWTLLPAKWFRIRMPEGRYIPVQGMGANVSVNATLLSLMAVFALVDFDKNILINSILLVGSFAAIVKTKAMAGLAAFMTSMSFYAWAMSGYNIGVASALIIIGVCYVVIADTYLMKCKNHARHIWSLSGRDEILRFSNKYIMPKASWLFGIGVGAYHYIMPTMQKQHTTDTLQGLLIAKCQAMKQVGKTMSKEDAQKYIEAESKKLDFTDKHKFIWLHCDPIQFFIEGGIVGTILLVFALAAIIAVAIMSHNIIFITFGIAFAVNAMCNFPCHMAPDSFLVILMSKVSCGNF